MGEGGAYYYYYFFQFQSARGAKKTKYGICKKTGISAGTHRNVFL